MTIGAKITLASVVPIVGICGFVTQGLLSRRAVAGECAAVQRLVSLTVKTGALVHELQKERGRTAGYVGSSGAKFSAELQSQEAATDAAVADFNAFQRAGHTDQFGASVSSAAGAIQGYLGQLQSHRKAVGALTASPAQAVQYYTDSIAAGLDLSTRMWRLKSDSDIATMAGAYVSFMMAKEQAGLERATATAAFSADAFAPGMFVRFASVVAAQNTYLDVFASFATEQQRRTATSVLSGEGFNEVMKLRQVALNRAATGSLGVSPDLWFDASTRRIDAMKRVEDTLALDLTALADQEEIAARRGMWWFSLIAMAIIVPTGLFSWSTVRGINRALRRSVSKLNDGAEQVSSASGQVASSSQSLAQGASELAASIQETSASTVELSAMTRTNADHSRRSAQLMGIVENQVERANATLEQMTVSMAEITGSSSKISGIIKVIDEIAFQTNILALNAAVEAARAGEAGLSFAVVADEVRTLAQRSAQAAKDTASLIEESIAKSHDGSTRLIEVAEATRSITETASQAKALADDLNAGSQQQTKGIEEIAKAIAQMERVTQSAAANAEQTAAASQELNAQASTVQGVVSRLQALCQSGGDR